MALARVPLLLPQQLACSQRVPRIEERRWGRRSPQEISPYGPPKCRGLSAGWKSISRHEAECKEDRVLLKRRVAAGTADRLPGSQGKSTMSMGCLSVFVAREPASHLLSGQSMYTFSVLSGRKTGQMSFLIWDGKGTGHATWEGSGTVQWLHCDTVIGVL